jgi:hypothetical protein
MFSNLGFSVSKFWGVIHHSSRYPTPRVPLGHHSWGIADVILGGQSPLIHSSFILRLCNRWYSFIHSYSKYIDTLITHLIKLIIGHTPSGSIDHHRAGLECDQPSRPVVSQVTRFTSVLPSPSQDGSPIGAAAVAKWGRPLSSPLP